MAQESPVTPVKLFVATLHQEAEVLREAISRLKAEWGEVDYTSDVFPFIDTDYYEEEMGTGLMRQFYSFERLISPDLLPEIKLFSNRVEAELSVAGKRRINLDPGYLDHFKVVLASLKFGGQKVYLRNGVYADMTMVMYRKKWDSFQWGFPDFKSGRYDAVLMRIREIYKMQRKESTDQARFNNA